MDKELITYLESFLTLRRKALFQQVLQDRTRYLTVVLEDLYQPHNASAVLRTCECFGIQDVHIIENRNQYTVNPDVALGASKWLTLFKYNAKENNTADTLTLLKKKGYRLVATVPGHESTSLPDFDLDKGQTALLFGTELRGLSDTALSMADEFLKIPMAGFTESFNISVSAGIILSHLTLKFHKKDYWRLSGPEKEQIYLEWLKKSIKSSDLIISNWKKKLS
ncbi:MAG: RNA methyltransferase [Bacteroidales bacterium]|nr:RNA methyltransferase [Bacteroidales bacterium]